MSTDKNHKEPAHSEPTTGASDHHAHGDAAHPEKDAHLSLIHISEPTRQP
jgi:hypothetical protein